LFGGWVIIDRSVGDDIYIYGLNLQPTNIPTADSVSEFVLEVGRGNPEQTFIQFPYSIKADTNVGIYLNGVDMWLPEPVFVRAGTILSMRIARDSPTPSTYNAGRLRYLVAGNKNVSARGANPENWRRTRAPDGMSSSLMGGHPQ
jgi:hypothetical protein